MNIILPGYIDTPGDLKFATADGMAKAAYGIPWQRLGGAQDIGRAAVFLCSNQADYITGSALKVDGGFQVGMALPHMHEREDTAKCKL